MISIYPLYPQSLSQAKMAGSLRVFSMKSPSSNLSFTKIKSLIHTLIYTHMCRIIRALSKAKTTLVEIVKEIQHIQIIFPQDKNKNRKLFFGSFRLHYNWCSSHVVPVPAPVLNGLSETHFYYDSTWNSVLYTGDQQGKDGGESQLSGYLRWLEEKVPDDNSTSDQKDVDDVDKLAEMFIANCHEKFRLEKEESYRRFQDMMARSI